MSRGTLRHYTKAKAFSRAKRWERVLVQMVEAYINGLNVSPVLLQAAEKYRDTVRDYILQNGKVQAISSTDFTSVFNCFSDEQCLLQFRFIRKDLLKMVNVIGWSDQWTHMKRNRYGTNALLSD